MEIKVLNSQKDLIDTISRTVSYKQGWPKVRYANRYYSVYNNNGDRCYGFLKIDEDVHIEV